ncbi:MAG: DUF6597 domain-containing transcriptional factor [Bacteroidia bacterium]
MHYHEFPPPVYLSHHIESYWQLSYAPDEQANQAEWLLPDCTFNIIFAAEPFWVKTALKKQWTRVEKGAMFFGQISSSINLLAQKPLNIFGVRFKPFAFANIIKSPIHLLNDQFVGLDELFSLDNNRKSSIEQIIRTDSFDLKIEPVNDLMLFLLQDAKRIDEKLRAQLNYILERKGAIQIKSLFSEFGVSKVTLRKHFIEKVGLTPKKVSRIWRMNYFLHLRDKIAGENLTSICLMAGFYDQAHFIKEFKTLFGTTPRRFFKQESYVLRAAQEINLRRFTNQYDPRV